MSAASLTAGAKHVAGLLKASNPGDIVVLARTSRLLREVVQACADAGISVHAPERAMRPSDAEQTALAYLRLASAPAAARPADIRQTFRVPTGYPPPEAEHAIAAALRNGASFLRAVQVPQVRAGEEWRRPDRGVGGPAHNTRGGVRSGSDPDTQE